MNRLRLGMVSLVLSAVIVSHAQAHEFWMIPHDPQSRIGAQVLFELRIGSGLPGKQTPRIPGLIAKFSATDVQGSYAVNGHDNSLVAGHLKPRTAGATVIALRTHEAQIALSASEFEEYLREEGLEKIIRERRNRDESDLPARELFSRCVKTIVLVDGQSQGFDKVMGQPLELIPLTEPLHYQSGEAYRLRLLRDGKPLGGALVKAQFKGKQSYQLNALTNPEGEITFRLPEAGLWLFSAEDMTASQSLDADWESLWASVTLAIGENVSS